MRRYAQDTEVAISRSREHIGRLLQEWSCERIGWMDDFAQGRVLLQFVIPRLAPDGKEAVAYPVQFGITLIEEATIRRHATGARGLSEVRYRDLMEKRGRREHRVLHLWIKAAFEAVKEGIVPFEAIFLPFFVRDDGATVAESVLPHLPKIMGMPAAKLLTSGAPRP